MARCALPVVHSSDSRFNHNVPPDALPPNIPPQHIAPVTPPVALLVDEPALIPLLASFYGQLRVLTPGPGE
ncbi:hypothetical protein FRC06_007814 [Ceratobasidium sp. 370]|nr:hypothetical protein FRC06_007814 [Ceratobasidium sp. 370]